MSYLRYLLVGILFGITLMKSEVISWYRIQEMFRFQDFHMYGVIGVAVVTGVIMLQLIKKFKVKSTDGNEIHLADKAPDYKRYILGGTVFGMGWALVGACPGPIYTLVASGFTVFIPVLMMAFIGAFIYGAVKKYLPH